MGTKFGKEPDVMLAPNAMPDLGVLQYPVLVSVKLDGIRGIIKHGQMLTRKMEPFKSMMVDRFRVRLCGRCLFITKIAYMGITRFFCGKTC